MSKYKFPNVKTFLKIQSYITTRTPFDIMEFGKAKKVISKETGISVSNMLNSYSDYQIYSETDGCFRVIDGVELAGTLLQFCNDCGCSNSDNVKKNAIEFARNAVTDKGMVDATKEESLCKIWIDTFNTLVNKYALW